MWRDLLLRTLAWRLQEQAFGGHDRATLKLLDELAQKRPGDQRCQRLKTGTVLIRDFEGVRHTVTIMPGGFIWQERPMPACRPSPGLSPARTGTAPGSSA
jgi:hypothetical protein